MDFYRENLMTKEEYEEEIICKITNFFNKDKKRALEWYNMPHLLIDAYCEKLSPKYFVENGRGGEVLKWINMCMDVK
jgi:hypothetical protein